MQYDSYELRIAKIAKFFKFIFKHMTKIIIASSVVGATAIALLATRGTVVSADSCPVSITYGEELDYNANAFLSGVGYEYSRLGTDEWTSEVPIDVGTYNVRAVSKATFGYRYGDVETFTIMPKEIDVGIASEEVVYGENPEVYANLAYNDTVVCDSFTYGEGYTTAQPNASGIKIHDKDGNDVTARYKINTLPGSIRTTKRPLEIKISDASKVYDGKPLQSTEYGISSGSIALGDTLTLYFDSSITEVGSVTNDAKCVITNVMGTDVTEFYSLSKIAGTLSVSKRPIKVTTPSASVVYNGSAHSRKDFEVQGAGLADGHTIAADDESWLSITDIGEIKNSFSFVVNDKDGNDVTKNYNVEYDFGTIKVLIRGITVETDSCEWVYDGNTQTQKVYRIVGENGIAPEHKIEIYGWGSILDVGSCENTLDFAILDENGEDVTANYAINYAFGTLTVTPRKITVTTPTVEKKYDAYELYSTDLNRDVLADGDSFVVTEYTAIINAGSAENEIKFYIFDNERTLDVTSNYEITVVKGTLTVLKREITVTSGDKTFVYNGKAQSDTDDNISVTGDGVLPYQSLFVTDRVSVNDVIKDVENYFTVIVKHGEEDVSANYDIKCVYGKIEVTQRPINVIMDSGSKYYDGTLLSRSYVNVENIVQNHVLCATKTTSIINAGVAANELIEYDILDADGKTVKGNYAVNVIPGELEVKKRPVTVTTGSAVKIYDATALTAPIWLVAENSAFDLVEGDKISANAPNGKQTEAGECTNTYDGEVLIKTEAGDNVTDNYELTVLCGNLAVLKRPIKLETNGYNGTYNGKEYSNTEIKVLEGYGIYRLCDGHRLETVSYPVFKDAITGGENNVVVEIKSESGTVSENYDITYVYGIVNISRRPITVRTEGYEGMYDGRDHSNTKLTVITDNGGYFLCDTHVLNVVNYPVFRDVITGGQNRVEFTVSSPDGDVTSNYLITYIFGEFNITPRPISITTNGYTGMYDGKDHSDVTINVLTGEGVYGLCTGHGFTVTDYLIIKNVVSDAENYVRFIITDGYEDVTENYTVTYKYGKVNVSPRPISVSTNGYTGMYDGYDHSDMTINVLSGDGIYELCDGHSFVVTDHFVIKNVVTDAENFVHFYITDGYEDVSANYVIACKYGKVNVSPRPISITTNGYTGMYDGYDHSDITINVLSGDGIYALCDGHEFVVTDYYVIKNVVTDAENFVHFYITDGYEDTTANYVISCEYGKVNVSPRPISITTNDYVGMYDGYDHSDITINVLSGEGIYGLCDGHSFVVTDHFIIKNAVKDADNFVYFYITNGYEDTTANYVIACEYGKVNVSPRPISVTTNGYTGMYDGLDHSDNTINVLSGDGIYELCDGHEFVVTDYYVIKNVAKNTENFVYFYISDGYEDVSANYVITREYGKVNVMPRPITVTTETYTGVYDGYWHGNDLFVVGGEYGLCRNHYIKAVGKGYKNVVTDADNTTEFVILVDDEDVTGNYDIDLKCGKINITPLQVKVLTGSNSWRYDGLEHKHELYETLDGTAFISWDKVKVSFATSIKDCGRKDNILELKVLDEKFEDITYNYDIVFEYGVLEVTKCGIVLVSGTASKKYDGSPLSEPSLLISKNSEGSLAKGHVATASDFASITKPGMINNTFDEKTVRILDSEGNDVTENYNIAVYEYGTLTVYPEDAPNPPGGGNPGGPEGENPDGPEGENPGGESFNVSGGVLDTSGQIGLGDYNAGGGEGGEPVLVFVVTSTTSGRVYLKLKSFGDYNGSFWSEAKEYDSLILDYASAYYLAAFALENSGAYKSYIKIESKFGQYMIPYYSLDAGADVQKSDVYVNGNTGNEYYLYYFDWKYKNGVSVPEALREFEEKYAEFVIQNYLQIDDETAAYMKGVIAEQGFDKNDPEILSKVARYIQGAAKYNMKYDRALDKSGNIAVNFLSVYKEGVCQHYATAATMLFRALGIPARYTIGFVGNTTADKASDITSDMAHAWVEVYVNGFGWVQLEVTGAGFPGGNGGESDGDGDEGTPGGNTQKDKITIRPATQKKAYDGIPLIAKNLLDESDTVLKYLLGSGFTYKVEVSGTQTEIGKGVSTIESFVLYDPYGNDVTDRYDIKYETGELEVSRGLIKIYLYEKHYEYSGTAYTYAPDDYVVIDIPKNVNLVIQSINISAKYVGYLSTKEINGAISDYITYAVYANGGTEDITSFYSLCVVNFTDGGDYVPIEITPREIIITTESATKQYDEKPLTNKNFYISQGMLADGDKVELEVVGETTSVGTVQNTINKESLRIVDSEGTDVSANYTVTVKLGTLTIT